MENRRLACGSKEPLQLTGTLLSHMPAFPETHRRHLIRKYLDESIHQAVAENPRNQNLRLELRFGEMHTPHDASDPQSPHTVAPLDLVLLEMRETGVFLRVECMAMSLALLHWSCNLDAEGVRIIAAGDRRGHPVPPYLHNLGGCKTFDLGITSTRSRLVDAFESNPTWPKPCKDGLLGDMWIIFRGLYLDTAMYMMWYYKASFGASFEECWFLPCVFIRTLEDRAFGSMVAAEPGFEFPSVPFSPDYTISGRVGSSAAARWKLVDERKKSRRESGI